LFFNGWIADEEGKVDINYASSYTRMHVTNSIVEQLLVYVMKTPEDGLRSVSSVEKINEFMSKNKSVKLIRTLEQELLKFEFNIELPCKNVVTKSLLYLKKVYIYGK
jgi:hypothetical protein